MDIKLEYLAPAAEVSCVSYSGLLCDSVESGGIEDVGFENWNV